MIHYRTPLDSYDELPDEMRAYLRHNGWHFNKKAHDWAVSQMRKENTATDKLERIEPWSKEEVDEMLTLNSIKVENNTGYDMYYVANMAKADFYKSSIEDEKHLAMFVKDMVDDADQQDGFIFNRWYADCCRGGIPVPWEELL